MIFVSICKFIGLMIVYYNNLGLVWIIKFVNKYIVFWVKFIFIFKSVCFLCDCIFFVI